MRRDHHQGLAQVHCLADGFKAGSGSIGPASCHLAKELLVIQIVELQIRVNDLDRSLVLVVPEEMQRYLRMPRMPILHLLCKPCIENISQDIVSLPEIRTLPVCQHFRAKERRNHPDSMLRIVRHSPERQCQQFHCPVGYCPAEEVETDVLLVADKRKMEVFVQEKELVPDAYHRNVAVRELVHNGTEQLVEIHYHIRPGFLYLIAYQ